MSMNPFRRSTPPQIQYVEFGPNSSAQIERLIKALAESPIGETSIKQDLKAIIDMLTPLSPVPTAVELNSNRLETIHGLIFDLVTSLTTDPETIEQLAARVKAIREKLKTSVDNQTKES